MLFDALKWVFGKPLMQIFEKGQGSALRLLDAFVAPAFAANGNVAVVASDFNLIAFFDKIAV